MNPTFPCIDCITLSICKAVVSTYKDIDTAYAVMALSHRCSIIKDYLDSIFEISLTLDYEELKEARKDSKEAVIELVEFFKVR